MIVVGIDPGKTGAIFLYDPSAGLHEVASVPLLNIKVGKKIKTQPDYCAWRNQWSSMLAASKHVCIEQVGAMPGQGVTSMFSFGYSAGFVLGLVTFVGRPYTFLTPQRWKKIVGLSGSDGDQSRKRASQLIPEAAHFWTRKKDDGVAEAALIAYAGYHLLTTGVSDGGQVDRCGLGGAAAGAAKAQRKKRSSGG